MPKPIMKDQIKIGFVCVQNAGRSQMAAAFAEREQKERGLEGVLEIISGGTSPADEIHDIVIEAMAEEGIDLSDRVPTEIETEALNSCVVVATMGCSTLQLDTETDVRDWALSDPARADIADTRAIREEVKMNVESLFDEIESELDITDD